MNLLPPQLRRRVGRGVRVVSASVRGIWAGRDAEKYGFPDPAYATVRLLVGPVNSAGQAFLWARAAEHHVPSVSACALAQTNRFGFPADYSVASEMYLGKAWGRAHEAFVTRTFTHVLAESVRALFGRRYGNNTARELPSLRAAGIRVAFVAHGSDVRIPSQHAEREPFSPFRDPDWDLLPTLEKLAVRDAAFLNRYQGHVLVSTPDLLDYVPTATWCPVVVDRARWHCPPAHFDRPRPIVVHAPSSARMKGSEAVEPIAQRLHDLGVIEYRRLEGLTGDQMSAAYRQADVVLDQFRIGSYGVAACEGMAAGRVVIGHVSDEVRQRVRAATGVDVPILQATPDTLESVLMDLTADRAQAVARAQAGVDFVERVHDGRMAADAMTPFLAGTR